MKILRELFVEMNQLSALLVFGLFMHETVSKWKSLCSKTINKKIKVDVTEDCNWEYDNRI